MSTEHVKELGKAWIQPGSSIYLSKNKAEILRYCEKNGIDLDKREISGFLESRFSSKILYDDSNKRKIAQLGKPYVLRSKFFSQLHGDNLVLSNKFSYGTNLRYIFIIVCV